MSSGLTTMRSLLYSTLSAGLTAYEWHSGPPPASRVPNDYAAGYTWADRVEQDSSNKLLENVYCGVRVYLTYEQRLDPATPGDPSALEQAASDIQTTLQPAQYGTDPWYFDVTAMRLDHDAAIVDVEIKGVRWNDAAVGA